MSHAIYEVTSIDEHDPQPVEELQRLLEDGWEPYSVTWENNMRAVHLRRVVRYT